MSFWKSFAMSIVKVVASLIAVIVYMILAVAMVFVFLFNVVLLFVAFELLTRQPPLIAILGILGIIIVVALEVAIAEWLSDLGLFPAA